MEPLITSVLDNKHLSSGSIILCHNGSKFIKDALEAMIVGLEDKGFQIVPISQLIYTDHYYMDHEGRQFENN